MSKFQQAERIACKASILLEGLSGKGKTTTAQQIAYALVGDWEKVFLIDTENKSARLNVGRKLADGNEIGKFNVYDLTEDEGYDPRTYIELRKDAIASGAEVVISDSITHCWQGKGGVLPSISKIQETAKDKYAAWNDSDIQAMKLAIPQLIRHHAVHVITCVRVKEKMEYIEGADGKKTLKSLGEQQIMQDDLKYEPDLVLSMEEAGSETKNPTVYVRKSRYPMFPVDEIIELTPDLIEGLRKWLEEGADASAIEEEQRQEYITEIKEYIQSKPAAKTIWEQLAKAEGLTGIKLSEMTLSQMRKLFILLKK